MPVPRIDYDRLKKKVLVLLYENFVNDDELFLSPSEMATQFDESSNVLSVCVGEMVTDRLLIQGVRRVQTNQIQVISGAPPFYEDRPTGSYTLTATGRQAAVDLGDELYDELAANVFPDDDEAAADLPKSERESDEWDPLPIDRQSPEFATMVRATEAALEEIETNNGYAVSEPTERDGIVLAVKGTLATAKTGDFSLALIKGGLLAPLKYVAKKFADSSMGELAKLAVKLISAWLETVLG